MKFIFRYFVDMFFFSDIIIMCQMYSKLFYTVMDYHVNFNNMGDYFWFYIA